jgi:uncharacterized protein (DUF302 family)
MHPKQLISISRFFRYCFPRSSMKRLYMTAVLALSLSALPAAWAPAQPATGLVTIPSRYPVAETLDRLESELHSRGMKIFARIDFLADAHEADLEMRPTQLLIFGNPKVGTPLMRTRPSVALDLPLKALAWEDDDGNVWLSWNSPEYLAERHRLPELRETLSGVEALFRGAAR